MVKELLSLTILIKQLVSDHGENIRSEIGSCPKRFGDILGEFAENVGEFVQGNLKPEESNSGLDSEKKD